MTEELPPVLESQRNRMRVHENELDEEARYVQSRYFKERPLNELNLHSRMLESSFKSFVDEHKAMIALIPTTCAQFLKREQNSYAGYRKKYMDTVLALGVEIKRKEALVVQEGRNRPRDYRAGRSNKTVTSGRYDMETFDRNDRYSPPNDRRNLLSLQQRQQMRSRGADNRTQAFDRSRLGARIETMSVSSAGNTDEDVLDLYIDEEMMNFAVTEPLSSSVVAQIPDNQFKSVVVVLPNAPDLRKELDEKAAVNAPNQPIGHEIADEQLQQNGCRCCDGKGHSLTNCPAFLKLPRASDRSALILRWKLCVNCFIKFRTGKKAKPHKCLAGPCGNCPGVKPHHPLLCPKKYP